MDLAETAEMCTFLNSIFFSYSPKTSWNNVFY